MTTTSSDAATSVQTIGTLLTAPEVASRLCVPVARVYELARTGKLPCCHLGRQVRFDATALREWIRSGGTAGEQTAITE
jgi:excisionase family DNA binding protein